MKRILALAMSLAISLPTSLAAFSFHGTYWEVKKGKSYEAVGLGIPASDMQEAFDIHVDDGYEMTLLDAYDVGGHTFFNFVFRNKTSSTWTARFGLSGGQYQDFYDRQTDRGRCLRHLDVYRQGNRARYLAIFKTHRCKPQRAYHGLSASDHQAKFDQWTGQGWDPVNVSVTSINGKRIYAAFYEKRPGGTFLKSFLTHDRLAEEDAKQRAKGRHIVYMDAYTHDQNTLPRISAIWREVSKPAKPWINFVSQQVNGLADDAQSGRYIRYVTGYSLQNSHRFNGALYKPRASGVAVGGISN